MLARLAVPNYQHNSDYLARQDYAIRNGQDRRRIDDHVRVSLPALLQQVLHSFRTQHLSREWRYWSTWQHIEVRNLRNLLYRLLEGGRSSQHSGQAKLTV